MLRIRTVILIIFLIAIIPLAIFNIFDYRQDLHRQQELVVERNLDLASLVSASFENYLSQATTVEQVALLAILRGDIEPGKRNAYLDSVQARSPRFSSIQYTSPSGKITYGSKGSEHIIPRGNIRKIRRGDRFAISPLRQARNKDARFHITTGIRRSGRLQAIVDGTINGKTVAQFLETQTSGDFGVIDVNGRAVAFSYKTALTWKQRDLLFIKGVRKSLDGQAAAIEPFTDPIGRVARLGASVPISGTGWAATSLETEEEVLAPVRQQALVDVLLSYAASLVALTLVLIMARVINKPVVKLASETEPFRRGKFDTGCQPISESSKSINLPKPLTRPPPKLKNVLRPNDISPRPCKRDWFVCNHRTWRATRSVPVTPPLPSERWSAATSTTSSN